MTRFIRQRCKQKKEAGFTLMAAVIFVMLIGFLGVVASFLFTSGTTTTKDYLLSARVFYGAEGGLERGIRKYLENSAFSGESSSLTLGSQSYPFTTNVYTTDFSGASLPANQRRIRSTGTFQSAQRVVEQIVQRQSVFSLYALSSQGNIVLGGTTYTSCPGGTGCPANAKTNQLMLPITVTGGLDRTISSSTTLSSGTYNYNIFTINDYKTLSIGSSGVTIYCKRLNVGNNVDINTGYGTDSSRLLIVVEGNVSIGNSLDFKGAVYAPNGSIAIGNSFNLNGAIAGNSVSIGNSSSITFDTDAGHSTPDSNNLYDKTAAISKVASGWQEVF